MLETARRAGSVRHLELHALSWLIVQVLLPVCRCQTANDTDVSELTVGSDQDTEDRKATEAGGPGTLHWALAVILMLALLIGLLRVVRVLKQTQTMTVIRQAPDGMRTAECGSCHTAQYVSANRRIFICYSCHCANRIPSEWPRTEPQELVVPEGPIKKYEFRRGGEHHWQELSQVELEEGDAVPPVSTDPDEEARLQTEPQPELIGKVADSETESNLDDNGIAQCVVCLDNPGIMVVLPCAHGSVCEACVTRIVQNRASGGVHCPHCRSDIDTIVKIHEVDGDLATGIEIRIPMARPARNENSNQNSA